jgi:hypothetical protein
MVGEKVVDSGLALEFLRNQIARNRGLLRGITDAALSFGVTAQSDGLTEWHTIYIGQEEVRLESGAVPVTFSSPMAVIFTTDEALSEISSGRPHQDISAEGDKDLLSKIARCFSAPQSWLDVRSSG